MLERLCLPAGLGMPRCTPGSAGGIGWGSDNDGSGVCVCVCTMYFLGLTIVKLYREQFKCLLRHQTYTWLCELDLSTQVEDTFMDMDSYQISLIYSSHGNNKSLVLMRDYMPVNYIQPIPPLNLTFLWKPDEAVFQWLSGYNTDMLIDLYLMYELRIHTSSKVLDIHPRNTNISVPMSVFVPDTNFTACVRSAPNQEYYKGVWSHWSPSIHWNTGPVNTKKNNENDTRKSFVTVYLAFFLPLLIMLCYIIHNRWKRCMLKPSPAPHIGDFKVSAVMPENVGELLHREKCLQFDSLAEDLTPALYTKMSSANTSSETASLCESPRPSDMFQSAADSKLGMDFWMQAFMSAEKEGVTYSDGYCILSHTPGENANTHI